MAFRRSLALKYTFASSKDVIKILWSSKNMCIYKLIVCMDICVYITDSLFCIPQEWHNIVNRLQNAGRLTDLENELTVAGWRWGERWGKGQLGSVGWTWTHGCIPNAEPGRTHYSTGNTAQGYVAAWMGEGFRGEGVGLSMCICVRVCVGLSPFTVRLKLSQRVNRL